MTPIVCPKCQAPVPVELLNTGKNEYCPYCNVVLQAEVFPALLKPVTRAQSGDLALEEGQATCFYHPQKTAHVPCDACGRFICTLCEVELDGEHLCPNCVESGRRKGRITSLEQRRVLYNQIAVSLAIVPVLAWPVTILTAPATIVFSILTWRKPASLVTPGKALFVVAIIIALAITAGWGVGIYKIWEATRSD